MSVVLSLRDVWLSYRRGPCHVVPVLREVSLEVHAGEIVAVRGARGRGKSSLLRLAAGMERPTRGEVVLNGTSLWQLSDARRSRALARDVVLLENRIPELRLPIATHIATSLMPTTPRREAYARAEAALAQATVAECASATWEELSDHERVLAMLAHGLARRPRVLLVDDLTATLGMRTTEQVGRLLRDLADERGTAVLMSVSGGEATTWSDRLANISSDGVSIGPRVPPEGSGKVVELPSRGSRRASA